MRRVRRVRTSTWILTAVFLVTLVTWVLVMPTSTATVGNPSTTGQPSTSSEPARTTSPPTTTPTRHADEFGVPDWHTTPGPLADGDAVRGSHAVRGSDANSLSHRFGVTLAGPPGLSCREPVGDGADDAAPQTVAAVSLVRRIRSPASGPRGSAAGPGRHSAAGRAAAPRGRIRRSGYGDGSADPRPAATAAGRRRRPASR